MGIKLTSRTRGSLRLIAVVIMLALWLTFSLRDRGFLEWLPVAAHMWIAIAVSALCGGLLLVLTFVEPIPLPHDIRSDEEAFAEMAQKVIEQRRPR